MFVEDLEGRVLEVNKAACRLHGRPREALIGQRAVDLVPENVRAEVQARHPRWVRGELTRGEGWSLTASGECIPVDLRASRIVYRGQPALLFLVREMVRRRLSEGQHVQAEKMEALGKLAGGIAHDFNNLLMVIMNNAAFVREQLAAGSPAQEDLDQLTEAADEAAALTGQLLSFCRKQMFCPRPLDMVEVLREARGILRTAVGEDVALNLDLPEGSLGVIADRQQLVEGLTNLAANARDAMEGGGRLTIRLCEVDLADEDQDLFVEPPAVQGGEYVKVEVRDTGKGMDPQDGLRVFEPFFTTKARGRGTGLGLSTTYGMVRQHDGYMSLRTGKGLGATFAFYLPLERQAADPSIAHTPAPQAQAVRGTVLLAEDNRAVRVATRRMLEHLGFEVLEAADGFEALEVAARDKRKIDLLFTDVVMPGMDGKTLADQMCRTYPETKVVFASGYPEDHLQDHGLIPERVALLQKPFNREQVAQAVGSVMG
jgi:PAS domain S-box-containing protein